ncbi:hypothetical protein SPF06_21745 [Sinomonas sp. JGH33]|uniref:DUF732 domain-containing protein n=1 Tax=Sinomonas terricola TaxID=3110330 RepID=A0ABU5TCS4_9MICC|nr:hypothetical protein [Sinomonas sp. JGH33]MEA5457347.1 hypothetical protein [Sinomonas sp. JGH33]
MGQLLMTGRLGRVTQLVGSAVTTLVLAACGPGPGALTGGKITSEDLKASAQRERNEGHLESAEMLADGAIDKAEYDKAFSNLSRCMGDGGYRVTDPVVSPVDGLAFAFDYDPQGRDLGAMSDHSLPCEQRYWLPVSAAYMATHEQKMDEPLRSSMQKCMKAAGYDISDEAKTFRAIAGDPFAEDSSRDRKAMDCFGEGMTRLYPAIKSAGIW